MRMQTRYFAGCAFLECFLMEGSGISGGGWDLSSCVITRLPYMAFRLQTLKGPTVPFYAADMLTIKKGKQQIPKTVRERVPFLDKWRLNGNSRLVLRGKRLNGNKFQSYTWVRGAEPEPEGTFFPCLFFRDLGFKGDWTDTQTDHLWCMLCTICLRGCKNPLKHTVNEAVQTSRFTP